MRELQEAGVTFLFISHHLQEVYEICQAVTVLRDARHIVSSPVADLPKQRLIEAMTGEQALLSITDAAGRRGLAGARRLRSRDARSRTGALGPRREGTLEWTAFRADS
jgi:simple sugar transport system ATP-binding protein